jgi:hypothetical protein
MLAAKKCRKLFDTSDAAPNNSFNPTGMSVPFIRKD